MIRYLRILSIALPLLLFAAPTYAASPYTDNFETYNSEGWSTAPAGATCNVLPDATTTSYTGARAVVAMYHTSGACAPNPALVSFVHTGTDQVGTGDVEYRVKMVNPAMLVNFHLDAGFCVPGTGPGSCTTAGSIPYTFQQNYFGDTAWHVIDIYFAQTSSGTTTLTYDIDGITAETLEVPIGVFTARGIYFYFTMGQNSDSGAYIYVDDITDAGGGTSQTRITSVVPADGSTIATSTAATIGVTGYMSAADFKLGSEVDLHYTNGGFASSIAVGPALADLQQPDTSGDISFPITSPGPFSFSTNVDISNLGNYTLDTKIIRPRYTIFGFNFFTDTLVSTSTFFVASTTSAFGTIRDSVVRDYLNFSGQASSTVNTSVCNPISGNFSIVPCVGILFIPSQSQISTTINSFHDGILAKFPWGYVTRFGAILVGSATSTLPDISVNVITGPATSTDLLQYNISPTEMFAGGAALLDNTRDPIYGKNLRDIFDPLLKLLIGVFILIIIWHDLMAMPGGGGPRVKNTKI